MIGRGAWGIAAMLLVAASKVIAEDTPEGSAAPAAVVSFAPNSAEIARDEATAALSAMVRTLPRDRRAAIRIEGLYDVRLLNASRDAGIASIEPRSIHQAGRDLAMRRAEATRDLLTETAKGTIPADRIVIAVAPGSEPAARLWLVPPTTED